MEGVENMKKELHKLRMDVLEVASNLLPGDVVLADRDFDIDESVGLHCAKLKIPAFTKGKSQLKKQGRCECVIGLVRKKYQILQTRAMSIKHMAVKEGKELAVIDKIAVICCALSNLSESVVPSQ